MEELFVGKNGFRDISIRRFWEIKSSSFSEKNIIIKNITENSMSKRSPRERFVDLAEKRTEKAISTIRLIGNLSNKRNYEYTQEDVEKITYALQKELRTLKNRFSEDSNSSEKKFKL